MPSIRIRLFATARVTVGRSAIDWAVPSQGSSARQLLEELGREYPRLAPTLRISRVLRNGAYLGDLDERLLPGDEFAVHPPYGGG